mgnify:CR=1 FL=1
MRRVPSWPDGRVRFAPQREPLGVWSEGARISQAAWNRFYYYLTTDERSGDLMTEVRDAEQKLYDIDPMRLALPREKYPCTLRHVCVSGPIGWPTPETG